MLVDAAQFFLNTLVETYAWLLLARFYLHWVRAPLRNPLGEVVCLLTNPLVLPLRRLLPAAGRLDTATLSLAYLFELACLIATLWLHDTQPNIWVVAWVAVRLLIGSIYILIFALFIEALISWTYPHAPFAAVLRSLTLPFLRPLRRFVPPQGGVDFSFLVLFFLCYVILKLPLAWLELAVLKAIGVL